MPFSAASKPFPRSFWVVIPFAPDRRYLGNQYGVFSQTRSIGHVDPLSLPERAQLAVVDLIGRQCIGGRYHFYRTDHQSAIQYV